MHVIFALGTLFLSFSGYVRANTEKTIFIAPSGPNLLSSSPSLDNLYLTTITPERSSLRTTLPVSFPTSQEPGGNTSVYLLRDLTPGQRYEVRICWLATQPTDFTLITYTLIEGLETSQLSQALASYAKQQQDLSISNSPLYTGEIERVGLISEGSNSEEVTALFLYVLSAAAFYTTNQTLMLDPPPVLVDIILDPYLLNVFPRSLVPTAGYILGLAILGWYLSGLIWNWLISVTQAKSHTD
ncbi:hypothetical protein EV356DRAFT_536854 [Viridothelium virens]|uniref:Uncharacterized protein n=1 Tax=Viridothelium virens TaxID=1048519 RepID=A0A6A6GWG2_VIRVR|nr:hypothetical protein EV356DRAFT_536854 [Viridothelium virens]